MSILDAPYFRDDDAARAHLEAIRWPEGPFCPHCGSVERINRLQGKSHRAGLYKCYTCRKQFTVTVGTVFERSRIPLHLWFQATYLLCSSKKGISSHQIHRVLGVAYKTAWFMSHRIREAMREGHTEQLGLSGRTVEVDETFWGNRKPRGQKRGRGFAHKEKVLTLLERGGTARSFHVPAVNAATLLPILREQIAAGSVVNTDEAGQYKRLHRTFPTHESVNHGIGEYVRGEIHTNTLEGFFSLMKRGLHGAYHHVSKQHLKRYLCEFDFRYNYRMVSDIERTGAAMRGIEGKRITYRQSLAAKH